MKFSFNIKHAIIEKGNYCFFLLLAYRLLVLSDPDLLVPVAYLPTTTTGTIC